MTEDDQRRAGDVRACLFPRPTGAGAHRLASREDNWRGRSDRILVSERRKAKRVSYAGAQRRLYEGML